MSRRADLERVADRIFGWKQLRPAQLDAMEAVLAGRDVLAVMPTGSGKSAIYQVPAILIDGVTLVISPLIALQQDQIAQLDDVAAPDAVAINSRQGAANIDRSWQAVEQNEARYIFLAPEQLTKDDVIQQLRAADVADAAERVDRTRVEMMRGYAEIRDCRRQFLLGYFGEQLAEPCGNCDRCEANAAEGRKPEEPHRSPLPVDTPVEHKKWGSGVVISGEEDRVTVLFDEFGYRTLSLESVRASGVLQVR